MNISAIDREQRTFGAKPESARAARQYVGEILLQRGASESVIRNYQLVISELVANVIEHDDGTELTIFSDYSDHQWWDIGVIGGRSVNMNPMNQPETWTVAASKRTAGRGLGIVRKLMDDVVLDLTDDRVSVRCRHRRVAI
ncbi:MAG: ATP-binding protein [Ilumatobacteraceae bacterium]